MKIAERRGHKIKILAKWLRLSLYWAIYGVIVVGWGALTYGVFWGCWLLVGGWAVFLIIPAELATTLLLFYLFVDVPRFSSPFSRVYTRWIESIKNPRGGI